MGMKELGTAKKEGGPVMKGLEFLSNKIVTLSEHISNIESALAPILCSHQEEDNKVEDIDNPSCNMEAFIVRMQEDLSKNIENLERIYKRIML